MLVMMHKEDDVVRVGDSFIKIVEIRGKRGVRLGYEFPREVEIVRDNARLQSKRPTKGGDCRE